MAENENTNYAQPSIPMFDGYYDHWAMLMENMLRSKEYQSIVEGGIPIISETSTAEQRKNAEESKLKDLKAKNQLFQSIDRNIIKTILDKSSSKAIWDSMKRIYQGSTKVKRAQMQAIRKEFETLAMRESETVNEYLASPNNCEQDEDKRCSSARKGRC